MKTKSCQWFTVLTLLALATINSSLATLFAQGTAFTYQGRLNYGTNAANGSYDLKFALFDTFTTGTGTQQGNLLTNSATAVTNGLFTVQLDFGNQFPGAPRWLEIGVRSNGVAVFTPLTPRQPLTPAPYAFFANTASNLSGMLPAAQISGAVPSANFSGTYGNALTLNNAGNSFSGTFSGNGASVTGVNAATLGGIGSAGFWTTNGNTGANPANGAYLGTADNQPLELRVNGQRGLRLEYATSGSAQSVNVIGGYSGNSVSAGLLGATIAGGGDTNDIGPNFISAALGTIGGGAGNTVSGNVGTVAGGGDNTAGFLATVSGGNGNQASSEGAMVPGGEDNTASGILSFAAGNRAQATNNGAFVWADEQFVNFYSTNDNSFNVRAQGGARFVTSGAGMTVDGPVAVTSLRAPGTAINSGTFAFTQRAVSTNVLTDFTIIYNPITDNDSNALLFITHNWMADTNSTSKYNTNAVGVFYFSPHWAIFNEDQSPMALGRAFNVLVVKP